MESKTPIDENKMNKHYEDLLDGYVKSASAAGEDVKGNPHNAPASGTKGASMMNGGLMTFTKIMEAFSNIRSFIESDDPEVMETPIDGTAMYDEKELLEELNKIFTPVLVMQNFEKDIADKSQAEMESANVLTERSIIKFDDESRMAQLINVCAKLIAKAKNTKNWQMFKQAAAVKKEAGLAIQKEEYNDAVTLAQKYLIDVSSSNPSSVARDAALELWPQTRH